MAEEKNTKKGIESTVKPEENKNATEESTKKDVVKKNAGEEKKKSTEDVKKTNEKGKKSQKKEKNNNKDKLEVEREYTIPLRKRFKHVSRVKKTPKAVKSIKEFLVRHMKVRDRDLRKIKLDRHLNEMMWSRGIKNPLQKIKIKAQKYSGNENIYVSAVELPNNLNFKKQREEKSEKSVKKASEKVKTKHETASGQKAKTEERKTEETKETKEKEAAAKESTEKLEKQQAKKQKHTATGSKKEKTQPKRQALKK